MSSTGQAILELHAERVGGVDALWAPVAGDFLGALVFGVGGRDLTPTTIGLHHLVEHLVMRRVGRVTISNNAQSSADSIMFYASGEPAAVADFLGRVSAAVAALDEVADDDLAIEVATIAAEVGQQVVYARTGPLALRWGTAGLGVTDLGHAPLASFTADDVREFAATWLVTGNARLVFTGPPPDGLNLDVPDGDAPARPPAPEPLPEATPAIAFVTYDGVTLSFVVEADALVRQSVGAVIEEALMRRLRLDTGHVYSVQHGSWSIDEYRSTWVLALDPDYAHVDAAVRTAREVLAGLAADGPDTETLDHAREATLAAWRSVDGCVSWLLTVAEYQLRGIAAPTVAELLDGIATTTAETIRDTIAGIIPSLIITVPTGVGISAETGQQLEADGFVAREPFRTYGEATKGEVKSDLLRGAPRPEAGLFTTLKALLVPRMSAHRGRRSGPRRGQQIWIGPRMLVFVQLGMRIEIDDLVLVGTDDDGDVELVTRHGGVIYVNPAHWRHRRRAAKWLRRFLWNVPPSLVRDKTGFPHVADPR